MPSRVETLKHIETVGHHITAVVDDLIHRASRHDHSKLRDPEKGIFDKYTPLLKQTTFGSPEYERYRQEMGVALEHHYRENDHHPEHFEDGIHGMNLVQLMEMLCDWKAASERHDDGDLRKSIEINAERFGYGPEMTGLLTRTADYFGWLS